MIRTLSLFSGIGGADLGLHRAGGFKTVAFCEVSPDRRSDLARLFPGVKIYDDVLTLSAQRLAADGIFPDFIAGGFPCQNVSAAGPGGGIGTEDNPTDRSGLWFQFARIIEEISPRWVAIENSPNLRNLGLETILRFLDARGYDAFWDGIPARAVGAYHERDRLFIVANLNRRRQPNGRSEPIRRRRGSEREVEGVGIDGAKTSNLNGVICEQGRMRRPDTSHPGQSEPFWTLQAADTDGERLAFWQGFRGYLAEELAAIKRKNVHPGPARQTEPGMVRDIHDVPPTMDGPSRLTRDTGLVWKSRIHALGNAVLPGIFEAIGRAIIRSDKQIFS